MKPHDLGPSPAFIGDEVVVDLPYLELVGAELRAMGVRYDPAAGSEHGVRTDDRLSLALLAGLRMADNNSIPDLDVVLAEQGRQLGAKYGGWLPAIGKNRHTTGSLGFGGQPQSMLTTDDPPPVSAGPGTTAAADAGRGVRVNIPDTKLVPHPDLDGSHVAGDDDVLKLTGDGPMLAQAPAVELVVLRTLEGKVTARATAPFTPLVKQPTHSP